MYRILFPYVLGIALAWVTCYPARALRPRGEQRYFVLIMAAVAVAFVPFPLERGNMEGTLHEAFAAAFFIVLVVLSLRISHWILPLAFAGHAGWDLFYLLGFVSTDKPLWLVQLCVPYDGLVAIYVATRLSRWRVSSPAP